ncbi:MAG: hypothetical protein M1445_09980 [Bacteroidetes bacterium]|nr:hypothetical protein [Bacteroidota bacterium]
MSELIKYINELPGYKISDTHFRLGSKIHIAHFYYAKRLFQNSFFASRLAFLIAKEILTDHRDKIKEFEYSGLSLIGYGLYSELLISLVEKFLKKKLSLSKINHDLISDADEPSFIKNYGNTYKYIVIIVPIGSTFSTAIKIKEFLTDIPNDNEILEPFINVLHISHFPSDPNDKPDIKGLYEIEKNFGWTDRKGKTIWIKDLSARNKECEKENVKKNEEKNEDIKEGKEQKYLLALKSEWHDVKNCSLCALDGQFIEKPLYFTDKSSVTPTLIFGKPRAREIKKKDKNKFILSPEILQCAHLKRDANHFHYYIRIEDFFRANIEKIETWLETLKQKKDFKNSFDETSRVIIIAPGHYSNAGFLNLVNEKLFSNAANIIHYDTYNDHISNFGLLYGKELQENGTQILFVDDTITTGSTFRKINFFVENAFIEKTGKAKTFNACIILMDRSNLTVHKNVLDNTVKYYSFANLHLPSLKDFDGECPLDIGFKRYSELAKNSFLTRLQIQFENQKDKLQERYIDSTKIENKKPGHNDEKSYIRQVEAIHRIYEWSRSQNHKFDQEFEDWKKSLLEQTESPFSHEELSKNSTDINGLSDETATLLKILTHSPFIHYKPVKDNLFNWVLTMLKEQINIIIDFHGN